ncbi:ATP-dependent zinc metalloprotease FtsH [Mycoplasma sp. ES3157-GEN-MYC]|uniref:ATP-dependent zinc metalloprotease FtsH n=1 Tax=Mycoplasma miroungigenitalium TaxID=754515 RepID=A0A6M4J968_9MOLU|nr:ATP-dependent zinc metalloprotease FtsH [Mycoplasma miroungigenitalium]MBU4690449.1 ATP-dependent zinc metalloprotease FtsH [Mycoplasma miroungigenitalium]QJR43544.1 ATP-dependent zinc metalloprotease FtsH [Mycoplasma miroungigenitalium]
MRDDKTNQPKKSKLTVTLLTILGVIVAAVLIWMLWEKFKPTPAEVDINAWHAHISKAIANTSDNTYIRYANWDTYNGLVNYEFVDNGKSSLYTAKIGRENIAQWFSQNERIGALAQTHPGFGPETKTFASLLNDATQGSDYVVNGKALIYSGLPSNKTSILEVVIRSALPLIIFILIGWLFTRSLFKGGMVGMAGEDKSVAQKVKSDKRFKDIAGNREAIEEISEIVDYLKDPKKYVKAGARMPHGILLGGPPGTGKTLLAKATAGEANVPFYFISASNFVEMYVGLGAKRVRNVVAEARKNAPAIIFIDELDAIGRTRGAGLGGGHDEREQTLNQLLVEMDGMTENTGLLFFAATNRTDVLDPALIRPGRFDRQITVGLPDVKEREEILELHAKGKRIAPNVNLAKVAKRTPGYSGAQLENVINEASLLAVRFNHDVITLEDIDEAIDRVMSGPAKKNRVISEKELTMVAYHEAGHAVVGIKVPGGNKVQKITIIPRGQAGGYNLMTPEEEKYNMSKQELISMITSFMGGRAAEEIIYGAENISTGASDDIQKATKIARKMVTEWGMSGLGPIQYEADEGSPFLGRDYLKSAAFSPEVGHEIDLEVRKIVLEAQKRAHEVINNNRELLELIKTALLDKETIVAEEIEYIAEHMKLPPKSEATHNETVANISLDELLNETNTPDNNSDQK